MEPNNKVVIYELFIIDIYTNKTIKRLCAIFHVIIIQTLIITSHYNYGAQYGR